MNKPATKLIIGIMGGVCSGKSAVAKELAKLGCALIDADQIAHQLLQNDSVKKELSAAFGKAILGESNDIDRQRLAEIAFADAKKLSALNGIIHPRVLERAEELIEQFDRQTGVAAIVLDMPLLAEVKWHKRCEKLIFVDCERQIRVSRLKKAGTFDEKQLKNRENFQISLDKKAEIADYIIGNNSGLPALAQQVGCIFSDIMRNR